MAEYLLHSVKYLVKLIVLMIIIYALMYVTGAARISADMFVYELLHENNGRLLMAALIVLSLIYPKFGFVKRTVNAGINKDCDEIMRAFERAGYAMSGRKDNEILFRASSMAKRIINVFDDKILVRCEGDERIVLEGIRKEVVQIEFRIKSYVDNKIAEK